MQPPYFIPATQCVLHLALRCVGQAAYKLLRSTSATSSISYYMCVHLAYIRRVRSVGLYTDAGTMLYP